MPLSFRNADETELCQSSTSLSNISRVFRHEKLVWRNEVMGKGSIYIRLHNTKWFTRRKTKMLNCYYGIVGCGGLRDSGYLFYFCFCFFFPGYALKCYQCVSIKSWDDCKSSTKEVTCSGSQDRCGKADVKAESSAATIEGFTKGCANSSDCSAKNCKSIYPSVKITKCEIDCCKGDLCNGAQVPMVSAIMLLACAILAFFDKFEDKKLKCSSPVVKGTTVLNRHRFF